MAGDEKDAPKRSAIDRAAEAVEDATAEAKARAARAAAEATAAAAVEAASQAASKVAHGVLDGLETLIFGRVGGAEEAATRDDGDPLDRLRARYAAEKPPAAPDAPAPAEATPPAPARPAKEDPVARAKAEFEALKAARERKNAAPDDTPVKKTL